MEYASEKTIMRMKMISGSSDTTQNISCFFQQHQSHPTPVPSPVIFYAFCRPPFSLGVSRLCEITCREGRNALHRHLRDTETLGQGDGLKGKFGGVTGSKVLGNKILLSSAQWAMRLSREHPPNPRGSCLAHPAACAHPCTEHETQAQSQLLQTSGNWEKINWFSLSCKTSQCWFQLGHSSFPSRYSAVAHVDSTLVL